MATKKTIPNDLIPMRAGIVRLTPRDANRNLMYDAAYTTKRDFLTSTQTTTTRTFETLPNGNGQDKQFPVDETQNVVVTTQTYDPKFHAIMAGYEKADDFRNMLYDTSVKVPASDAYEVDLTDMPPVASDDGKYHIEVADTYGNRMTQVDSTVESEGQFKYDNSTHKLTFHESAANMSLSLSYYIDATDSEAYRASGDLKNPEYQVEIMGETRSASSGEVVYYSAVIGYATPTGDIPNVTTQKSISNAITYNFASAPAPKGVTNYHEAFKTISEE